MLRVVKYTVRAISDNVYRTLGVHSVVFNSANYHREFCRIVRQIPIDAAIDSGLFALVILEETVPINPMLLGHDSEKFATLGDTVVLVCFLLSPVFRD